MILKNKNLVESNRILICRNNIGTSMTVMQQLNNRHGTHLEMN